MVYIYQGYRNNRCFRSRINLRHAHGTVCLRYHILLKKKHTKKVTVKKRALNLSVNNPGAGFFNYLRETLSCGELLKPKFYSIQKKYGLVGNMLYCMDTLCNYCNNLLFQNFLELGKISVLKNSAEEVSRKLLVNLAPVPDF